MSHNPHLEVIIADGYYGKLHFWAEFTFSQFDFTGLRDRVESKLYEAGHVMYIEEASRAAIKQDMQVFIEKTDER